MPYFYRILKYGSRRGKIEFVKLCENRKNSILNLDAKCQFCGTPVAGARSVLRQSHSKKTGHVHLGSIGAKRRLKLPLMSFVDINVSLGLQIERAQHPGQIALTFFIFRCIKFIAFVLK